MIANIPWGVGQSFDPMMNLYSILLKLYLNMKRRKKIQSFMPPSRLFLVTEQWFSNYPLNTPRLEQRVAFKNALFLAFATPQKSSHSIFGKPKMKGSFFYPKTFFNDDLSWSQIFRKYKYMFIIRKEYFVMVHCLRTVRNRSRGYNDTIMLSHLIIFCCWS